MGDFCHILFSINKKIQDLRYLWLPNKAIEDSMPVWENVLVVMGNLEYRKWLAAIYLRHIS